MKQINWLTVFFWSLIVIGFGIKIGRHIGYDLPKYGALLVVIGSLCLTDFHQPKKQEE